MRNGPWGLVVRTPAVGDRSGDVSETYHEGNAHQGCPRGRLWLVFGGSNNVERFWCEYLFTAAGSRLTVGSSID